MTTHATNDLTRATALAVRDLEVAAGDLTRAVEEHGDDLPALALARALVKVSDLHDQLGAVRDDLELAALGEPGDA